MAADLEGPDAHISLDRAAVLSGRSPETLRVLATRGRLRTVKRGRNYLTTRRWLHEYLLRARANDNDGDRFLYLPTDYQAPE